MVFAISKRFPFTFLYNGYPHATLFHSPPSDSKKSAFMAKQIFQISTFSILLSLVAFAFSGEEDYIFEKFISRKSMDINKEKLSHLSFYWHDIVNGSKPTSMMIVPPPKNTTVFREIYMIDNALTLGPQLSSKLVGRAQGFYAVTSLNEFTLMNVMNFAFVEGKYNGSTLTILGRNPVIEKVREMAVIGGSGLFRYARGYAQASTYSWNRTTGDANVHYDVYVSHY
ncbi:Dirigent protein 7 [Capsicum annuum]|uniref:Dirigent protein n=1 Tax=Capsicum annuum TaxID=4072 RepID=A0A2G3AJ00_CAPAN|nr:Dirigent protein 7 [Capsicum annuum]